MEEASGVLKYLLRQGEAKALKGVKVSTSVKEETFSAISDAEGRFELTIPGPGSYTVQAALAPYKSASAVINLSRREACAIKDFGLVSGSSISGKVRDHRGQPLRNVEVGIIDLDSPPDEVGRRKWLRTIYPEQRDGSFLFQNVPLGRYHLAFNPDGPQATENRGNPLEVTFHTDGTARARPAPIEINGADVRLIDKDVVAGQPVAFRQVRVKVQFADGSPMTTAAVRVSGEPLDPGGLSWHTRGYASKDPMETRFQVPTNRKIRISVSDRHGRELKKTYESSHAPGDTPVIQVFVIDE